MVKPWPGIVDVEPMPALEAEEADGVEEQEAAPPPEDPVAEAGGETS
jgi:hypothetical protein